MTVYIDSFILVNFCLNLLLLTVTKKILHSRASKPRLFIGSVIGVVYAVFMFVPNTAFMFSVCGKLTFSLILVAFTYRHRSIHEYLRTVVVFYVAGFVFGGCIYAVCGTDYGFSAKVFVTATVTAYFALHLFSRFYGSMRHRQQSTVKVAVELNGATAEFFALVDTGNSLTEPASGLPVMVAELKGVSALLPAVVVNGFENGLDAADVLALSEGIIRLWAVPFHSVGSDSGIIAAFRADSVTIDGAKVECLIGIYNRSIFADGSCRALVNPVML